MRLNYQLSKLVLYEETTYKEIGGAFKTGVLVTAAPPEYHQILMAFGLLTGYITLNDYWILLCSREEFEKFLIAVEAKDEEYLLRVGTNLLTKLWTDMKQPPNAAGSEQAE